MNKVWNSGPPPSPGWWPASICRDPEILRWYDQKGWWSIGVSAYTTLDDAVRLAKYRDRSEDIKVQIEWQDRPANWPERSRT